MHDAFGGVWLLKYTGYWEAQLTLMAAGGFYSLVPQHRLWMEGRQPYCLYWWPEWFPFLFIGAFRCVFVDDGAGFSASFRHWFAHFGFPTLGLILGWDACFLSWP